ncbi:MAG: spermidine synthase [Chitinophagales bacterium]
MPAIKQNVFKHLLSFVKEIQLETTSGDHSDSLEVVLFEGRYMLNTPDATYSFQDRYSSYRTALKVIAEEIKTINSVLVLGLGMGSIPQMLQKLHNYKGEIDCVEFDSVIIKLAEKYYPSSQELSKLIIHKQDAYEWVMTNEKKFDLIAVDLFINKYVPKPFHQKEFLIRLKETLSDRGVLLFSRLKENQFAEQQLWKNLEDVFEEGNDIHTGGNLIYTFKSSSL